MNLSEAIERYVAMKQAMGISYKWGRAVLNGFSRHVGDISLKTLGTGQVSIFLEKSASSDRAWLLRYRALKAFFDYWIGRNELDAAPLPPSRRSAPGRQTAPYIYSVSELRRLLKAASVRRRVTPGGFTSFTFRTLLLFLYATGARLNEAVSLKEQDIDLNRGTITVRRPFLATERTIPISPHLRRNLRKYANSLVCHDGQNTFFRTTDDRPLRAINVTVSFQNLRRRAGIARPGESCHRPKLRDLRRTFAVHCIRRWLRDGKDLRSMLPILGAYLGNVSLTSTELYLAAVPERFLTQLSCLSLV
jgi:integrase